MSDKWFEACVILPPKLRRIIRASRLFL